MKLMELISGAFLYCPIQKTCISYPRPLTHTKPHFNILVLMTFPVEKRSFGTSMQMQVSLFVTHDLKPSRQ